MRNLSLNMIALLAGDGLSALANFWELRRHDGVILRFTDWTADVGLFKAASGWTRSAVQQRVDMAPPNQEVTGIVLDGLVTEEDVRGGKYFGATIQHFLAVPTDADFLTYGRIYLPSAYIGELRIEDGVYVLEVRGLAYALQQNFIEVYTPTCRADFADLHTENRCKLDPVLFTVTGQVIAGIDQGNFTYSQTGGATVGVGLLPSWANFKLGLVSWQTGANIGFEMEIADLTIPGGNLQIRLYLGMPFPISAGDTFTAVAGCQKTAGACAGYGNIVNFRGEPAVPGASLLMDYGVSTT